METDTKRNDHEYYSSMHNNKNPLKMNLLSIIPSPTETGSIKSPIQ